MRKQLRCTIVTILLSLALLLVPKLGMTSVAHHVAADAPSAKTLLPPFRETLQGIPSANADWWTAVQEDIRQSEYHITWQDRTYLSDVVAAYQAPNRAHNLRTYFTQPGLRVIPRVFEGETPPWQWGLALTGYGYADAVQPVPAASLHSERDTGNRIEYLRDTLTEWYINDTRGLEQGFTLLSPPQSESQNLESPLKSLSGKVPSSGSREGMKGTIVLELTLSGDLTTTLGGDGQSVEFTTPSGVQVLRYSDLAVTDAAGSELPARLELAPHVLRIMVHASSALYPITIDPTITGLATPPAWTAESDQVGACLGSSVATAGDVNGDGYDDVIVSVHAYDSGLLINNGRVYVYHGSAAGLGATPAWMAESDQHYAFFGESVGTAGDVNGDGYSDVIVGACAYGQPGRGRAVVYHGSATGLGAEPSWTADGDQDYAEFGDSVGTAGDVNGDGFDDVIVGAPGYDNGQPGEGRAYVYHGSATGLGAGPAWTADGGQDYAEFGTSVATAGDVTGDGYSDVIIGAPGYDNGQPGEGRAYVYRGSATGLGASPAWTDEGNQEGARFGTSVAAAGDVNGDGYGDVIVGAPNYDNGQEDEGRAYVYHGSVTGLSAGPAWIAESGQEGARFGNSVATAGDVNGDGYSDIIVGAPRYDNDQTDEGRVTVYYGSPGGLATNADWVTESSQNDAEFGFSVATAGDVNGDGYSDVIAGAPGYDNGQPDEGQAAVYHGSPGGLAINADWAAESDQNDAEFGFSVATAGDVNGDGYSDVIVGAHFYDNGQEDEGRAYVYHGSATGLAAGPAWTGESDQDYAYFGHSVATAGDVNGDGYSDVIVGAPNYDNGQEDEGRAYVYHGSATGLGASPAWTAESDKQYADFGWAVDTAGDVNGDGYGDVVVGAGSYTVSQMCEGRAYVYHGSAAGLAADPAWIAEGTGYDGYFGDSVSTAGDVNGDGYSDVIVGAYQDSNGQGSEGRAYVYHGSATGLGANPAWIAESDQAGAWLGISVGTAGDVNGDGYSDVVVGARKYDNGQTDEGRAYVYHGSAAGLGAAPAWTAEGDQEGARFGTSVAMAGDLNGDGYSDVIVGSDGYRNGQGCYGRAFVYHGSAAGLGAGADGLPVGKETCAGFGASVGTAGDVNGDGYSDVIVGAPYYANGQGNEGRALVYHGSATGLAPGPAWAAESDQDLARFGTSVATAGDVNGDGYSDVIVGTQMYDNGQVDEGRATVYYGSATGLDASPAWSAEGDQSNAWFGSSAGTAGDVNGDGYSDVIVGAYGYDGDQTDGGRVYVYYGSATGLGAVPAWMVDGDQALALFGYSVATGGDVNGDGYSDVIVGAHFYDNGQTDEGRAYVYHGSATGLAAAPAWTAESDQDEAYFGASVGTAGDVNGDGYSDVIVAAFYYDNGELNEGQTYVYHGSAAGLEASPAWTAEGDQEWAAFGISVDTAGDVNGDGYGDVIVGANAYDNSQIKGRAYVYHGSATGLAAVPAWTAEGDQEGAHFGTAVATAGDVNGDGYSDIIVSADFYDNGQLDEGRVYAYHGDATGLTASPVWTAESDQAGAQFGWRLGTAGDVNGDGYSDVIIGAPGYDNGQTDEGQATVYYGNGGDGLHLLPRQMRTDGSAPIAVLGMSDSSAAFGVRLIGRMPLGRDDVRLQWQAAPLGTLFGDPGVVGGTSGWTDVLTTGVVISRNVTGLTPGTPYHWRVRLLYKPGNALGQPASRWVHIPWVGWNESDLRTRQGYSVYLPVIMRQQAGGGGF